MLNGEVGILNGEGGGNSLLVIDFENVRTTFLSM